MFKKTLTINHKEELTAEMIQDVSEANMQKALEYKVNYQFCIIFFYRKIILYYFIYNYIKNSKNIR